MDRERIRPIRTSGLKNFPKGTFGFAFYEDFSTAIVRWTLRASLKKRRYSVRTSFTLLQGHTLHILGREGPSVEGVHHGLEGAEHGGCEAEVCPFALDREVHNGGTVSAVWDQLIDRIRDHRLWGARKLIALLKRDHPNWELPCESSVNHILKKHGMVTPRKKRRRRIIDQNPYFDPGEPNQIWSADFKGKFRLGNNDYCYPLTIADSYSRYLFAIQGLEYTRTEDYQCTGNKLADA